MIKKGRMMANSGKQEKDMIEKGIAKAFKVLVIFLLF